MNYNSSSNVVGNQNCCLQNICLTFCHFQAWICLSIMLVKKCTQCLNTLVITKVFRHYLENISQFALHTTPLHSNYVTSVDFTSPLIKQRRSTTPALFSQFFVEGWYEDWVSRLNAYRRISLGETSIFILPRITS